jgi:hypothetical protein
VRLWLPARRRRRCATLLLNKTQIRFQNSSQSIKRILARYGELSTLIAESVILPLFLTNITMISLHTVLNTVSFILLLLPYTAAQVIVFEDGPGWSNLKSCVQNCFITEGGTENVEAILGCNTNACICRPDTLQSAGSIVSSLANELCTNTPDVETATSFLTAFCSSAGFTSTLAAVDVPTTTARTLRRLPLFSSCLTAMPHSNITVSKQISLHKLTQHHSQRSSSHNGKRHPSRNRNRAPKQPYPDLRNIRVNRQPGR